MVWRWSVCGTAEVVWKPRFLWQWLSAHLHFLVSCFSFSSWQYPIDSLWVQVRGLLPDPTRKHFTPLSLPSSYLFLCFASLPFNHASLLLFFLSAVDPDRFLDVHPSSEFVTFVLSSVYICFPIEGSWDVSLSYFRELVYNYLIYILFIRESQDSLAQFMANLKKSNRNV